MTLAEFLLARIDEQEKRIYDCDSDGEFRATWLTFRNREGSMLYTTVALGAPYSAHPDYQPEWALEPAIQRMS